MAILTTAELTLGLSRHLAAYTMSLEKGALGNLEFAGWVLDVAFRLRGNTTSPIVRVKAIGLDVGLSGRNLKDVMSTLEAMDWLTVARDADGKAVSLTEVIWAGSATPRNGGGHRRRGGRPRVATGWVSSGRRGQHQFVGYQLPI